MKQKITRSVLSIKQLFKGEIARDLNDFKRLFEKNIIDSVFLKNIRYDSEFYKKTNIWLKKYQGTNFLVIVTDYLRQQIFKDIISEKDCKIAESLVMLIINEYKNIVKTKDVFYYYWDKIKPIIDKAYTKGFISDSIHIEQKHFLLNKLELLLKESISTVTPKFKKEIINNIKIIDSNHPLVKRHEKEEKVFNIQKKQIEEKLDVKKREKEKDAERTINEKILNHKREAKKNYYTKEDLGSIIKWTIFSSLVTISALLLSFSPLDKNSEEFEMYTGVVLVEWAIVGMIYVLITDRWNIVAAIFFGWPIGAIIGGLILIPIIVLKYFNIPPVLLGLLLLFFIGKLFIYFSDRNKEVNKKIAASSCDKELENMKQNIESEIKREKKRLEKNILINIYKMTDDELNKSLSKY